VPTTAHPTAQTAAPSAARSARPAATGGAHPAAPPADARVPRRLHLMTTGEPDTLPRVLSWLRRRGCTVTRVDYARDDRHGPGRFEVAVEAPRRHGDRLDRGLENLVGVMAVSVR
jgi:acetolactate synthase regulatory subunit